MIDLILTILVAWSVNSFYHWMNPKKPYEPIPWNKDAEWSGGWQERLAKMAKEADVTLKANEKQARIVREQVKRTIPQEKRDTQYMPEELKKHLGLI